MPKVHQTSLAAKEAGAPTKELPLGITKLSDVGHCYRGCWVVRASFGEDLTRVSTGHASRAGKQQTGANGGTMKLAQRFSALPAKR
jgi:hypothetical protein